LQAHKNITANEIGDEPFQIYSKFPDIRVFVDEKRVHGANEILNQYPDTEVILLDDAYQHQHIKPGLSILLTDTAKPYTRDFVMPFGRLREKKKNADRADIILITKCPLNIKEKEIQKLTQEIHPKKYQDIFFSGLEYDEFRAAFDECNVNIQNLKNSDIILLTGIENPEPMIKYTEKLVKSIEKITFADHHQFTEKELKEIGKKSENKIIITTEKDAARLKSIEKLSQNLKEKILVLPMKIKILDNKENVFNLKLKNYVRENSRNS
jgi:tetraacyldisaccharide 4'-kinase